MNTETILKILNAILESESTSRDNYATIHGALQELEQIHFKSLITLNEYERALVEANRMILAIKMLRKRTGYGLRTCKLACEDYKCEREAAQAKPLPF